MNNNIINNIDFLNGVNINPIPLEFTQQMTTTKWLAEMQAKLTFVINGVNAWYDSILNDIENDGLLYTKINDEVMKHFSATLTEITENITSATNAIAQINQALVLLEYKQPSITISNEPSNLLYNKGETINSVIIDYNITKGTDNITYLKLYRNNILIKTINTNIQLIDSVIDGSIINSDVTYRIEISDGKNVISSQNISIKFVNNFYYGVLNNSDIITENLIKNLTPYKTLFDSIEKTFSTIDQKIIFAYPSIYGNLKNILDVDGFNIIDSFTIINIALTINGSQVPYVVYCSNYSLTDSNDILTLNF